MVRREEDSLTSSTDDHVIEEEDGGEGNESSYSAPKDPVLIETDRLVSCSIAVCIAWGSTGSTRDEQLVRSEEQRVPALCFCTLYVHCLSDGDLHVGMEIWRDDFLINIPKMLWKKSNVRLRHKTRKYKDY